MNVNMSKHSSVWIDNLTQHIFTFTEHPELWASDETKQISIFCQIFIMYSNNIEERNIYTMQKCTAVKACLKDTGFVRNRGSSKHGKDFQFTLPAISMIWQQSRHDHFRYRVMHGPFGCVFFAC